jgi:tRNA G18 (ribose-2'-O)-methylase SpoU
MRLQAIDDPMDPRVADYRDIQDADLRRRAGLFVAESRAVVHRLLASPFPTRSILLTPPALDGLRGALEACDAPVYVTTHDIAREVVGFDFHRGCIALGERGHEPSAEALIDADGPRLVVAMEGVSNPDNVGAIFRSASALGADAILLSSGCADPLYRKTIRVSMGAALDTPFAHVSEWAAGLTRLRQAGYTIVTLTPDPRALDIARLEPVAAGSRVALLVGAEHRGLGPESRAAADLAVRIAMAPGADSLNVATAAAIALHRLRAP